MMIFRKFISALLVFAIIFNVVTAYALADGGSENVASVTKDGNTTYVTDLSDAFTSDN